jgi:WD40 repeat protein
MWGAGPFGSGGGMIRPTTVSSLAHISDFEASSSTSFGGPAFFRSSGNYNNQQSGGNRMRRQPSNDDRSISFDGTTVLDNGPSSVPTARQRHHQQQQHHQQRPSNTVPVLSLPLHQLEPHPDNSSPPLITLVPSVSSTTLHGEHHHIPLLLPNTSRSTMSGLTLPTVIGGGAAVGGGQISANATPRVNLIFNRHHDEEQSISTAGERISHHNPESTHELLMNHRLNDTASSSMDGGGMRRPIRANSHDDFMTLDNDQNDNNPHMNLDNGYMSDFTAVSLEGPSFSQQAATPLLPSIQTPSIPALEPIPPHILSSHQKKKPPKKGKQSRNSGSKHHQQHSAGKRRQQSASRRNPLGDDTGSMTSDGGPPTKGRYYYESDNDSLNWEQQSYRHHIPSSTSHYGDELVAVPSSQDLFISDTPISMMDPGLSAGADVYQQPPTAVISPVIHKRKQPPSGTIASGDMFGDNSNDNNPWGNNSESTRRSFSMISHDKEDTSSRPKKANTLKPTILSIEKPTNHGTRVIEDSNDQLRISSKGAPSPTPFLNRDGLKELPSGASSRLGRISTGKQLNQRNIASRYGNSGLDSGGNSPIANPKSLSLSSKSKNKGSLSIDINNNNNPHSDLLELSCDSLESLRISGVNTLNHQFSTHKFPAVRFDSAAPTPNNDPRKSGLQTQQLYPPGIVFDRSCVNTAKDNNGEEEEFIEELLERGGGGGVDDENGNYLEDRREDDDEEILQRQQEERSILQTEPYVLDEHNGNITRLKIPKRTSSNLLLSSSTDGTIRFWASGEANSRMVLDVNSFNISSSLSIGKPDIQPMSTSGGDSRPERRISMGAKTGTPILAGNGDDELDSVRGGTAYIPPATAVIPIHPLSAKGTKILHLWAEENCESVWASCNDNHVRVWNGNEGKPMRLLKGHEDIITCLEGLDPYTSSASGISSSNAFTSSVLVATGSSDRTIRLWDLRAKKTQVFVFRGHGDNVLTVKWAESGRALISGGKDKTIRIWDTRAGR